MAEIQSNMSGTIADILVKLDDNVSEGQDLIILESMKMHIPIKATGAGKVTKIMVGKGEFVKTAQPLLTVE